MIHSRKQTGSAHAFVIIAIVIVIILSLGYAFWSNFASSDEPPAIQTILQPNEVCENDTAETGGVFCSELVGIKLNTPEVFQGKIKKIDNYDVFQGTVDYTTRAPAGESDIVYEAKITGTDNFTFTIAKEPLRSGYVDVSNGMSSTYYDTETKLLSNVIAPTKVYNASTGNYTDYGTYSVGPPVASFDVGETRIYKGTFGDAGTRMETYFAVINGSIVKIKLVHQAFMGPKKDDPATINEERVFKELDAAVKVMEIISEE